MPISTRVLSIVAAVVLLVVLVPTVVVLTVNSNNPVSEKVVVPTTTATATASSSPTMTSSSTQTASITASESATATGSASESNTATVSASESNSATVSASESNTATMSASESNTASPTISESSSPSVSDSPSTTPSISESATTTPSISESASPSISESNSPSISNSASTTPSISNTATPTASISDSATPSQSPSNSPSISESASPSITPTASPSTVPFPGFVPQQEDSDVYDFKLSPDESLLAMIFLGSNNLTIVNTNDGTTYSVIQPSHMPYEFASSNYQMFGSMYWSGNSNLFYANMVDHQVKGLFNFDISDPNKPQLAQFFSPYYNHGGGAETGFAVSDDFSTVLVGHLFNSTEWDIYTGNALDLDSLTYVRSLKIHDGINPGTNLPSLSPDGNKLVHRGAPVVDGMVLRVWDLTDKLNPAGYDYDLVTSNHINNLWHRSEGTTGFGYESSVNIIAWSPDNNKVAIAFKWWTGSSGTRYSGVSLFDVTNPSGVAYLSSTEPLNSQSMYTTLFSKDGNRFSYSGNICGTGGTCFAQTNVYDVSSGQFATVANITGNADDLIIATTFAQGGTVVIWAGHQEHVIYFTDLPAGP